MAPEIKITRSEKKPERVITLHLTWKKFLALFFGALLTMAAQHMASWMWLSGETVKKVANAPARIDRHDTLITNLTRTDDHFFGLIFERVDTSKQGFRK